MARQLAALPKKQFDMYRTKARAFGSGDHFNSALTSPTNMKENFTFNSTNHTTTSMSINGDCKNEDKMNLKTLPETEENKSAGVKSSKKKSKKKKKSKAVSLDEKNGLSNVKISSDNTKDSSLNQDSLTTNKLLDPDQSTSRIATMKRTIVADICADCCPNSQDMNSYNTSNKIWNKKNQNIDDVDVCPKQESKPKSMDEEHSYDRNDSNHQSAPPFGFPLSATKLIQSAVGLLDSSSTVPNTNTEPTERHSNDIELYAQQKSDITSDDARQDTSVEINGCIETNSNYRNHKTASTSEEQITSKKCDTFAEAESVDNNISNLSALEDEGGWQSQARRPNRKKKKELAGRNPRERTQAHRKDNKTSTFKKQSYKNKTANRNQSGTFNEIRKTYTPNDDIVEKDNSDGVSGKNSEEKDKKQEVKETFSYRDALLKTKPKSSEELQYNSDSGVDVNSVGSCDSAIHSSKTVNEFNLKEAVNFLKKGCDEIQARNKQGRVQYYSV